MDIINEPLDYETEFETLHNDSPMKDYYRDKIIFLTGGLGFLGQLYVEKLLRADVKCIYLLLRQKKGKNPESRLKETFCGTHFSQLQKHDPQYLKRLRIIEGDLEKLNLGICENDLKDIYDNVEIILHAAADVRFDEKLLKLLMVNLRGTRELCIIAEKTKNLQVFSYISTGYSHCPRNRIDEEFYESPVNPDVMIALAEKIDISTDNHIEILTERIIRPWPNTYTYSKSLSEELVRNYGKKFPICIIRPTIVISTFQDPIPAWCNNIYGLNGVLVACGMGVLRLMPLNHKLVGDIICADFVINSTLAAIWVTAIDERNKIKPIEPEIYHVSTGEDRPTTWGDISKEMTKTCDEFPSARMLWRQCPNSTICPFMWKYLTIFYHVIPGVVLDLYLKVTGKENRLLPVYRKVHRFMEALKYFMQHEWKITNTNMKRVWARMSKIDQDFFPSDVRRYKWSEFTYNYNHGLRMYIGREPICVADTAKKRYNNMVIAHYFLLLIYYGFHVFVFGFIAMKMGFFNYLQQSAIDTYEFIINPE